MPKFGDVRSVVDATKRLTAFLKTLDSVPIQELEKSARTIQAEAIAQTPYDTGKLERSVYARVSKDKKRPGLLVGASAKSGTYNYAVIQHENTHFNHPVKGKAHFIRDPFNKEVRNLKRRLKSKVRLK